MEDYPELSKGAAKDAQKLIDKFKSTLRKAADDVLTSFYCDILPFVEMDSWSNFQNRLLAGLKDYQTGKSLHKYDFKEIRKIMFREHKEEIIKDLDADILAENERLKECIKLLKEKM